MTFVRTTALVIEASYALLRFDVARRFRKPRTMLVLPPPASRQTATLARVVDALNIAVALYWKPVGCLQHSVCLARLLRRHGFAGEVVIGYRPRPFLAHAWVTVDGAVINESSTYASRLEALHVVR
jgi:hypothetical protein